MATFKQHKGKYRWLTYAFRTVFSNIATLPTLITNVTLEVTKQWAKVTEKGYKFFLGTNTSMYWGIDSVMDAMLNVPEKIHDIFVANITQCYELIHCRAWIIYQMMLLLSHELPTDMHLACTFM